MMFSKSLKKFCYTWECLFPGWKTCVCNECMLVVEGSRSILKHGFYSSLTWKPITSTDDSKTTESIFPIREGPKSPLGRHALACLITICVMIRLASYAPDHGASENAQTDHIQLENHGGVYTIILIYCWYNFDTQGYCFGDLGGNKGASCWLSGEYVSQVNTVCWCLCGPLGLIIFI